MIELLISLAITSVLVGAVASSILLATRALPDRSSPAEVAARGAEELARLLEDLERAVHITDRSPNAITFVVPDRDADKLPEVIRYAFSGTPGDPLTRQYNGGPIVDVADAVQAFEITYETTAEQTPVPTEVESSNVKFLNVSSGGATGAEVGVTNVLLDNTDWYGEYFHPAGFNTTPLPADAISWSIESAVFRGRRAGANATGAATATLYLATPQQQPDPANVLGQDTVWESWLPLATSSFTNVPVGFDEVTGLAPDQDVCFVLSTTNTDPPLQTKYFDGPLDQPDTGLLQSVDGGASWDFTGTTKGMRLSVYGRYIAPGPPLTLTREYVTQVRVLLKPAADAASWLESSVHTVNLPEALTRVWETDFSADPTLLDLDADDIADWRANGGAPFNTDNLRAAGYWYADEDLATHPGCDFDELTTIDLRFQDAQADGEAGGIKLRVDRTGDTYGFIKAEIEKISAGTQRLTVSAYETAYDFGPVFEDDLPPGFFDLRILVDPDRDVFTVSINGQERGTFSYTRISQSSSRVIRLYETWILSGVQFDHLKIRVGGTIE